MPRKHAQERNTRTHRERFSRSYAGISLTSLSLSLSLSSISLFLLFPLDEIIGIRPNRIAILTLIFHGGDQTSRSMIFKKRFHQRFDLEGYVNFEDTFKNYYFQIRILLRVRLKKKKKIKRE